MSSTFTGPIRVNTRQTTSNNGVISADNTGAVVLTQQTLLAGTAAATVVLPAGSIISGFQDYITVAGTTATPSITVNGTSVGTISMAVGVNDAVLAATTGAATVMTNVGTADATVSVSGNGSVAGVFSVTYTQRNPDGTIAPYGSGYTNN
jgi:hypothetical protein